MVNRELLKTKIEETGMPITTVSKRSDMNVFTLHNKLKGKTEFNVIEALSISETLKLNEKERNEIFFAK